MPQYLPQECESVGLFLPKFGITKVIRVKYEIILKIRNFIKKNQNGRLVQKCYLGNAER